MAKSGNQKLKLMYLRDILLKNTDESHAITMSEIIKALEACGINAERKSLYDDFEMLREYGMDIQGMQEGRSYNYKVLDRPFELVELKLLVDCVQSAKFLTTKKSNELIKKIENLASKYEASQLQRQVYVSERVKTMNESIYYNVDMIHNAISSNTKISFNYFQWNVYKKEEIRRNGERYIMSPWALSCNDDNYYMVAFDEFENKIKHFRVDKMLKIEILNEPRVGKKDFSEFDMGLYARKFFGMFDGEETVVRLECDNSMAGVIIDRFGKNVMIIPQDENRFITNVKVAVSRQFLGWIIGLGSQVKIVGPAEVVDKIKQEINRLNKQYTEEE